MSRTLSNAKLVTSLSPGSALSEAYRTLRTNIMFSSIDNPVKTIMVTSANPGDGKTTTVANLAVTYAQEGKRTLLVDADLRKPSLHYLFMKSNRAGLTHALFKENRWQDIMQETDVENLSLMTSGSIAPNPTELLSSQRMQELVEELRGRFDIVLFDTPPLAAVTDGLILSSVCDGVILVVRSGKTKTNLARKVLGQLEFAKAKVLGAVLNNKKAARGSGYQYVYGH
jgi:capsular exopolysaccharide synthesis family protein